MKSTLWLLLLAFSACGGGGGDDEITADAAIFDFPDALPAPDVPAVPDAAPTDARVLTGDILADLRAIPGLSVSELTSGPTGYRFFNMTYRQPVDHHDPDGPTFTQRLTLLHRDYDAPVVLYTNGYMLDPSSTRRYEPTTILNANQISVEHRFFGNSRPAPLDWTKLDIYEAANDHHRITVALKEIYRNGRWLNTGISKDGMTATYHRRFYPDDVDGTVAYVAPLSLAGPDPRYVDFVAHTGVESCRPKLRDLQRVILSRRATLVPMMGSLDTRFDILGADVAFEHTALEAPFGFWQYQGVTACSTLPTAASNDNQVWSWLRNVADISAYGDDDIEAYYGYYYQSAGQLGWPQYDESNVADLLQHPGTDAPQPYSPAPVAYDSSAMADIDGWVRTQGKTLMFIYGGFDPWSAGAYRLGDAQDSYLYTVEGGNHGSAIVNLPAMQRDAARATIRRWGGVEGTPSKPAPPTPDDLAPLPRRPL